MKGFEFFFYSSCRQSVHLCLLLHRVQRHGHGWPLRPVSAPVGESAASPAPAALFASSGLSCLNNFAGVFAQPSKDSFLFPVAVVSRVVYIPLIMLCNVENSRLAVIFSHDCAFVTIMALFSFSNGYLATLCMAYAPQ